MGDVIASAGHSEIVRGIVVLEQLLKACNNVDSGSRLSRFKHHLTPVTDFRTLSKLNNFFLPWFPSQKWGCREGDNGSYLITC